MKEEMTISPQLAMSLLDLPGGKDFLKKVQRLAELNKDNESLVNNLTIENNRLKHRLEQLQNQPTTRGGPMMA